MSENPIHQTTGMRLTAVRRRALALLAQRGPLDIQEVGAAMAPQERGFKSPQAETRFGGSIMAPLRKAGFVVESSQRFAWRWRLLITDAGRTALAHASREAPVAIAVH